MEKIVMISLLYLTFTGDVKSTKFVEIWEPQNCAGWYHWEIKSKPKKLNSPKSIITGYILFSTLLFCSNYLFLL